MCIYIYICYDHSRSSRYISTNLGKLKQAKSCQPGLSTSGREDVMEGIISRVVELCWTSFQRILFLHQPRLGQSFCLCHQPWCFFTVFGLMLMMLMLFPPRTLFFRGEVLILTGTRWKCGQIQSLERTLAKDAWHPMMQKGVKHCETQRNPNPKESEETLAERHWNLRL